jgi:hypothetical protein
VKALGWPVFGILALLFTGMFATGVYATLHDEDKDPPDVAARKAECRKVIDHIIALTPDHAEVKTPIEDVEQCGAAYPESVACMGAAKDVAAVHECLPAAIECKGKDTEVTGKAPVLEVVGECDALRVTVSNSHVVIKAGKTVEVTGNGNKIDLKIEGAKPAVADKGTGNTIK